MCFTIRRYEFTDQHDVLSLHDVALRAAGAHAGRGPWDEDLSNIEEVYLRDGGEFFVGFLGDRLVAMGALARESPERAKITRMRVDPDHHRQGFGQAVLSALEHRALELGYSLLHLDTAIRQEAAQGLYVKNGYREISRREILGFESIFYEKTIQPV